MKRRAVALQSAALGLVTVLGAVLAWKFPLLSWLSAAQRWVQDLGPASIIAYPLLYAFCNVLLLPAGVLIVGAGFFFGLWWGFAVVMAGNILGAAIAFTIARTTARKWVERKMLASERWRVMDEVIGVRGGHIVFLSQLHPLFPTSLLNYFYGITRLSFRSCLGWVALGQIPGAFLYVYLGTLGQHGIHVLEGKSNPHWNESILWIGGLLVTLAITIMLGRLSVNLLEEIDGHADILGSTDSWPVASGGSTEVVGK